MRVATFGVPPFCLTKSSGQIDGTGIGALALPRHSQQSARSFPPNGAEFCTPQRRISCLNPSGHIQTLRHAPCVLKETFLKQTHRELVRDLLLLVFKCPSCA